METAHLEPVGRLAVIQLRAVTCPLHGAAFELHMIDASKRWMHCHSVFGGTVRLLSNLVRNLLAGMSTLDISNPVFRVLMIELSSSSLKPIGVLSLIRVKSVFCLLDLYNVSLHHTCFPSEIAWPGFDVWARGAINKNKTSFSLRKKA